MERVDVSQCGAMQSEKKKSAHKLSMAFVNVVHTGNIRKPLAQYSPVAP